MMPPGFKPSWLMALWIAAVSIVVATTGFIGANASTIAVLLALGTAPAIVVARRANRRPSPSLAPIRHSVGMKERRR